MPIRCASTHGIWAAEKELLLPYLLIAVGRASLAPALEGSPAEGVDIRPAGRKPMIGEGEPLETSKV